MTPDDPRHGTYAGTCAHWNAGEPPCDPCSLAGNRYSKRNRYMRLIGSPATIPALGTIRRIQALQSLGWTHHQIADAAGVNLKTMRNPLHRGSRVTRATAEAIAAAYELLSMRFPAEDTTIARRNATYARNVARKKGWPPPLAWDDIDCDAAPRGYRDTTAPTSDLDPVVVERVLAGDRLPMTTAERREVVARARRLGWSEEVIHARTGIARATDASRYEVAS